MWIEQRRLKDITAAGKVTAIADHEKRQPWSERRPGEPGMAGETVDPS